RPGLRSRDRTCGTAGCRIRQRECGCLRPGHAVDLSTALQDMPGLVFEAHSTDYQSPEGLAALVQDGFAILKVGPRLTFAMREALYGLDAIAGTLRPSRSSLVDAMEGLMLEHPSDWAS